jgi:hypothetical protein
LLTDETDIYIYKYSKQNHFLFKKITLSPNGTQKQKTESAFSSSSCSSSLHSFFSQIQTLFLLKKDQKQEMKNAGKRNDHRLQRSEQMGIMMKNES